MRAATVLPCVTPRTLRFKGFCSSVRCRVLKFEPRPGYPALPRVPRGSKIFLTARDLEALESKIFFSCIDHQSSYPVFQMCHMEIDQQPNLFSTESEI